MILEILKQRIYNLTLPYRTGCLGTGLTYFVMEEEKGSSFSVYSKHWTHLLLGKEMPTKLSTFFLMERRDLSSIPSI
jgi:hypothetical protein